MLPGALLLFLIHAVSGHTPAQIFRYVGYTGCDTVTGSVIFHAATGVQQMIIDLKSLPPNATGLIQIRNGVNCFEPFQAGGIFMNDDADAFPFEADANGTVSDTLIVGDVTVNQLMGRIVYVLLQDDNSTTPQRIGCGTVGLSYPGTLGAYPGAAPNNAQGSIAVTGPLEAIKFGEAAHGPTMLQLAFSISNLEPSSTGKLEVFSGSSCADATAVGTLWGTNWTSTYTADATGAAVGTADITTVSPSRGLKDYQNHVVVVRDSADSPLACAVLKCPEGSVEEGASMKMQHGFCIPTATWAIANVVAADLYSVTSPLQVQVSGAAFDLSYKEVRSYPACAEQGKVVTTSFFVRSQANVERLVAGQFTPVTGGRQIVALGDKQPESVGRQDNHVNVSFLQSTQPNVHDVVHLAVGVDEIIFRVAAQGHRSEARLHFGSNSKITFPAAADPTNTTVWITNVATGVVVYQKAFLFGKSSPNFVWFLYGWDSSAEDCSKKLRTCASTPITVTTWPGIRDDYGVGVIPPVSQFGSSSACVPGFLVLAWTVLFF